MNIHPNFRIAGIGAERIKLVEECFPDLNAINHLATEGADFLTRCLEKGVLKKYHNLTDDPRF